MKRKSFLAALVVGIAVLAISLATPKAEETEKQHLYKKEGLFEVERIEHGDVIVRSLKNYNNVQRIPMHVAFFSDVDLLPYDLVHLFVDDTNNIAIVKKVIIGKDEEK